ETGSAVGAVPLARRVLPDNTAFDQQRLPAWQPVLSAGIVIPGFLLGPVFLYYGLSNYFQNVRGYGCLAMTTSSGGTCPRCVYRVRKRARRFPVGVPPTQLLLFRRSGRSLRRCLREWRFVPPCHPEQCVLPVFTLFLPLQSPSSSCAPYQYDQNTTIAPCGSVANSMFNDTFTLYQLVNATRKTVPLDGKGIAWWTDYNIKFRNPPEVDGSLAAAFNGTVKPVNWPKPVYDLDPTNPANNGFLNQDFLVWMRTAALPDFWKLYRRITEGEYASGLPAGNYTLEIQYNYPVANFAGRKSVIFSNTSWMGGKNQFLGIAYLVTGSLCVVMSAVMLIVYAKFNSPDEDF
uniref:Cell cycle control protein n=1 Tax=Scleropages formosus TaxID=113540 RepID=A0A8C9T6C3_SCLFO